jgi:hypothetical protein
MISEQRYRWTRPIYWKPIHWLLTVDSALAKACCENGCYFFGLAGMRRSLFKAASSRKRFWS